ncbi:adenine deaminase [Neobacillus sp. NPDC093127]|uniref:adenine deaminase n=1 Tax=Neobacillus sp. NPDC093127 TaxID=3364296 RepID=UPI00382E38FC
MNLYPKSRKDLIEAALGKRPMDLLIKNVKMLNCFTGEVYPAEIGIYDGFIAHIETIFVENDSLKESMEAKEVFDGKGNYLVPGFIDSHVHIESSMLNPVNFTKTVLPLGTTTVITDPHEVANVVGLEGIRYMLEASEDLPMRQYILAPSCVPSVKGLEYSGAEFGEREISEVLNWDRVIGLAEVMDFEGVIQSDERVMNILQIAEKRNLFIQGHAPLLNGRRLSAYLCAGIESDHESYSGHEAMEKIRQGMYVDARESSFVQSIGSLVSTFKMHENLPNLSFCTDDREPSDLINEGHINYVMQRAIDEGMNPIEVIISGTYRAAKEIGIKNLGAIAPGYVADLILLPSQTDIKPISIFFNGKHVANNGKLLVDIPAKKLHFEETNTIKLSTPNVEFFKIKAPIKDGFISTRVITYGSEGSPITKFNIETLPVKNNYLDISQDTNLKYVAVINRHGRPNYTIGLVRNFGISEGAVGSTVSHDSHNLTIVYSNPGEAVLVAKELIKCGGGVICVKNDRVLEKIELPIFGLMSKLPCDELSLKVETMNQALKGIGIHEMKPLLKIATLCLPVIPTARITDLGLVSVMEQKLVTLFL